MAILHFTLATRDPFETARFFHEVFGWKMLAPPGNVPLAAAWLEIALGQQIHLVQADLHPALPHLGEGGGEGCEGEFGRHIALSYPVAKFAELKKRLAAHGAELVPPIRPTPFQRFFFRDPNGYVFEVIEEEFHAEGKS
jgi:catechol 2,3-dioxygenase-like lactoylglutathione lyase family enzyme